jgi:hypothetical protein
MRMRMSFIFLAVINLACTFTIEPQAFAQAHKEGTFSEGALGVLKDDRFERFKKNIENLLYQYESTFMNARVSGNDERNKELMMMSNRIAFNVRNLLIPIVYEYRGREGFTEDQLDNPAFIAVNTLWSMAENLSYPQVGITEGKIAQFKLELKVIIQLYNQGLLKPLK